MKAKTAETLGVVLWFMLTGPIILYSFGFAGSYLVELLGWSSFLIDIAMMLAIGVIWAWITVTPIVVRHMIRGHYFPKPVDLGLSVSWGDANLIPSEIPYYPYYQWGTKENDHNWKDDGRRMRFASYSWYKYPHSDGKGDIKKYCAADGLSVLLPEDDCAVGFDKKYAWRMPTIDEANELIRDCNWRFESGKYVVTGPNGNSITIEPEGYFKGSGTFGGDPLKPKSVMLWTSSLAPDEKCAYALMTGTDGPHTEAIERCFGLQVRPVANK